MPNQNRYSALIENIFFKHFKKGAKEIHFKREEIVDTAAKLSIKLPKNLGDVIYSFRYRKELPIKIKNKAPKDLEWVIRPTGQGLYKFSLSATPRIIPNTLLSEIKILDATPGIINKYAMNDEQGLLAKLRYNRLVDIFTSITCYSLQNHLRTTVKNMGQVETDELYVGVDKKGVQYILPVQAKGGTDQLGIIQIEQDFALCEEKFPNLFCIPIAAQFMEDDLIAMFLFELNDGEAKLSYEKHYRLVKPEDLSEDEVKEYKEKANIE